MEWIIDNYGLIVIGFIVLEKIVRLSPCKWDDILIDGLKAGINEALKVKNKNK